MIFKKLCHKAALYRVALHGTAFMIGSAIFLSASSGQAQSDTKVFNYFRASAHKSLDPQAQFDSASADIVQNVYDSLLEYSYLERPYKLEPNLLEKMPEKQADGVTFILTLRKGLKFHDDAAFPGGKGREVKADDVIYSLKRFADVNSNPLSYGLMQGFVVGMDEFREATRKAGKSADYTKLDIPGLKKLDDYKVAMKLTRDNPLALYGLALSQTSIVAREVVEKYGDDFQNHPVGTGPFIMAKYDRRGEMILKKNPNYHGVYPSTGSEGDKEAGLLADAGKRLPFVDEVRLPLIEETQPAMLKFKKGELDWIGMNKDDFNAMATRGKDGKFTLKPEWASKFQMYTEPSLSSSYIIFNSKDATVGKNVKLRQAIAYGLDAAAWIDLLRNGRGVPLKTIVPLPIAGSEQDVAIDYYTKNVAKAKQLLAEAGYPNGKGLPELSIEFRAATKDSRQDFEFIRNELSQIGIRVKGNFQQFSAFLKKVEDGNFQMADAGWAADYPDAENFYAVLHSKNKTPGPNHGNFENAEFDKLYDDIRFMPNNPERFIKIKRMAEIVRDEVPVILRWNHLAFGLYQPRVTNMKRHMMTGMPLKYLNIDPTKKVTH